MKNKLIFLFTFLFLLQGNQLFAQGCEDAEPSKDANAETTNMKVFGFVQAQYDNKFYDNAENTFLFKRARIGVTGSVSEDFTYYVVLENAPLLSSTGSSYLLDAFITYHNSDWAMFSLGSFKQPFGLEVNTACNGLTTIERSIVSDQLVAPQRDMGVMWLGGSKATKLRYSLALMNGRGLGVVDNNKKKDVVGRLTYKAFDFLMIGGSYRYGYPTNDNDDRTSYALEATAIYKNLKVQGEYIYDEGDYNRAAGGGCGATPMELGTERQGAYVIASYATKWNIEPVFKYEFFDADLDVGKNMLEVVTFGANYHINKATRLQLNYQYKTEAIEIENDALLVQLQVKF